MFSFAAQGCAYIILAPFQSINVDIYTKKFPQGNQNIESVKKLIKAKFRAKKFQERLNIKKISTRSKHSLHCRRWVESKFYRLLHISEYLRFWTQKLFKICSLWWILEFILVNWNLIIWKGSTKSGKASISFYFSSIIFYIPLDSQKLFR